MKNEDRIIDIRSTGRRKGRKELFNSYVEFSCSSCGKTTINPPKDKPPWFEELWPEENRVLTQLQVQHQTKDLMQNDATVLKWMCPSCHKKEDMITDKGESVIDQTMWG